MLEKSHAHAALRHRVLATVEALDRRGYALPVERLARVLHEGPAHPDAVLACAAAHPSLEVTDGLVHLRGRSGILADSRKRARSHPRALPRWRPVALAYAKRLVRHCPWVECVLVSGSLGSGGLTEEDDIDISLVVEDDAKYLTYVAALLLALPVAWRHRGKPTAAEAALPLLPKVICINVVWTRSQTRPFARQDVAMALELQLSRPVHGASAWRDVLHHPGNRGLVAHFPQLLEAAPMGRVTAEPSLAARALSILTGSPRVRRALEGLCYAATRALHGAVKWWRARGRPEALAHVERVEATKRPYGILERPGRP